MSTNFHDITQHFAIQGALISAVPYGSGHINDTYKLTTEQNGKSKNYILQRINNHIFPNVDKLMENIQRVTEHIRRKVTESGRPFTRETLTIIPTLEGGLFQHKEDDTYWRIYEFIEGASTVDFVTSENQAYQAAKTFGNFQKQLADIPGGPLFESIPKFHDTPDRFKKFLASLQADKLNRAILAKKEIEFALSRKEAISFVVEGLQNGTIPSRVTHNDTKINNVMMDNTTGEGVCVIDLDTVMPGSVLYDFGDQIRTTTVTAAEDERDLSKVQVRLDLMKALLKGYLDATQDMLTPAEKEHLTDAGSLITFEIGLRFLTDFLDGDTYFKVHREGHNLDRCRTQFEMVRQMLAMDDTLKKLVNN